ncbi:reverse transcriptase [Gossypium australe]|uniref:Reverse transcriptase n=1 Tax=Gossypium australe TaxID=47621 RepID=A0A5B6X578_9ROSI|nr:reverse transcriptase [Gossypium australe]
MYTFEKRGEETKDEREIAEAATSYFQKLFTSNRVRNPSYLLPGIKRNITPDKNIVLSATYTEVISALKGMGPTKAPGPDDQGFNQLNSTDIVFIPKIQNSINLASFRPISLCSVLYKIVTKVIANRLQEVIGGCIDMAQSAFIPGSEGLSALMRLAKEEGLIKGAKASRRGPEILHLLFAEDCILFGEGKKKERDS